MKRGLLICCSAMLLIFFGWQHISAETSSLAKVDPDIIAQFQSRDSSASYLVWMQEQADLSAAYTIQDWDARGWYVYHTLRTTADASQQQLRELLEKARQQQPAIEFEPYYIINAVAVQSDFSTLSQIATLPEVRHISAEPQLTLPEPQIRTTQPTRATPAMIPYGIEQLRAVDVWEQFGERGKGVVVANLDTGVAHTHPALAENYRGRLGTYGYDHNYNWYDFAAQSPVPVDNDGHGTHTMGTIAGNDANTVYGLAPDASWMTVRVCTTSQSCYNFINAAQWALAPFPISGQTELADPALRPNVVNNSWEYISTNAQFQQIADAWHAAGMIAIFAAGNHGGSVGSISSPGEYCNVIGVGASAENGSIASFSGRGPGHFAPCQTSKPDLAAPGVDVLSAYPPDDVQTLSGTSMASPHVAGCVALLLGLDPTLSYAEVFALLTETAQDLGAVGFDYHAGHGRVDCYAAASKLTFLTVHPESQAVCGGDSAEFQLNLIRGDRPPFEVTLSQSGAPAGGSASFTANPISAGWPATTTLLITAPATASTSAIALTATTLTETRQVTVTLNVFSTVPASTTLLTPADNAINVGQRPNLTWQPVAAERYLVEIASDSGFANVVYSATVATAAHQPHQDLPANQRLYWRVTPQNPCGVGAVTGGQPFQTTTPIIFVSPTTHRTMDGASWATAFNSLALAMQVAAPTTEIWVASGTYTPGNRAQDSFELRDGVHVYGGFAGDEASLTERNADPATNATILDGNNVNEHVVSAYFLQSAARLDGFTVRGGNASDDGGGIFVRSSQLTLSNLIIEDNAAYDGGGGLYASGPMTITLQNSVVRRNRATRGGGIAGQAFVVSQTRIEQNHADFTGGGMHAVGYLDLTNVHLRGNTANLGGGMLLNDGKFNNVLFVGNVSSNQGGGIYMSGSDSTPHFTNTTFVRNRASVQGGAIYDASAQFGNAGPRVTNSIFWRNTPENVYKYRNGHFSLNDSLIEAGCPNRVLCGGLLLTSNPLFVQLPTAGPDAIWGTADDVYGDQQLQPDSPALDAGNNSWLPQDTTDLDQDGNVSEEIPYDLANARRRIDATATDVGSGSAPLVDLGAYECQSCGIPTATTLQMVKSQVAHTAFYWVLFCLLLAITYLCWRQPI